MSIPVDARRLGIPVLPGAPSTQASTAPAPSVVPSHHVVDSQELPRTNAAAARPELPLAELEAEVKAGVAADPQASNRVVVLSLLSARKQELQQEVAYQQKALEGWREEHGGFDSMARVGAGLGKMAGNLFSGKLAFWEGAGKTVTDAETLETAPQRARLAELSEALAEVDAAASRLASGEPLLPEGVKAKDFRVAELAAELSGKEPSPAQQLQGRLAWLKADVAAKNFEAGLSHYASTVAVYQAQALPSGEGVETLEGGASSVTARLNGLAAAGLVALDGKSLATAADLRGAKAALAKAREEHKEGKAAKALEGMTDEALEAEAKRLEKLEQAEPFKSLAGGLAEANAQLESLRKATEPGLWEKAVTFGKAILDSPETYAMVAVGAATAGRVGKAVLGARAVTARELGLMAVRGGAPGAARQLTVKTAGQFAAGTTLDAVAFHTLMNGFNLARGKSERATWSPADYARTVLMFQVLGGVQANATRRAATKLLPDAKAGVVSRNVESAAVKALGVERASALARNGAVQRLSGFLPGTRVLGEEVAALTMLAEGEQLLRDGNLHGAQDVLLQNFEFLLAMRALGGVQYLRNKGSDGEVRTLLRQERRTQWAQRMMVRYPTEANTRYFAEQLRLWATQLQGLSTGFVARGVAPRAQQLLRSQTDVVSPETFKAYLDAARGQALSRADLSEAERGLLTARYDALAAKPMAFFDPVTGRTLVNRSALGEAALDRAIAHEVSHQLVSTLPPEQLAMLTTAFTADAGWKALRQGFDAQDAHHAKVSNEQAIGELVAQWSGATAAQLSASPLLQQVDAVMAKPEAKALGLDVRGLDGAALKQLTDGRVYNNESGEKDLLGLAFPEYEGPKKYDFPGAGLFQQRLWEIEGGRPSDTEVINQQAKELYQALFSGGERGDLVALYRALALTDPALRASVQGTLNAFSGDALNIPNRSDRYYVQRLATLPFVAGSPEARKAYVDAVNLKARSGSDKIKQALALDESRAVADKRGVWDAVFLGAGPHSQAAISALRAKNPDAKVLVIEGTDTVSQFSDTGEAFYVNSSGYQNTGGPARPASGEGDLNPLGLNAPVGVSDLQSLKYAKGRDIGDAATVNLEIAGPDVLLSSRVEQGNVTELAPGEGPAQFRIDFTDAKTGKAYAVFTNFPVIASGISRPDFSSLDPESRSILETELQRAEGRPEDFDGDVAAAAAARRNAKVNTTQGYLSRFRTDGDPNASYRGDVETALVGGGDSGLVTAASLKGALSAPDGAGTTYGRRQLGDVGPVRFLTGLNGPASQREFATLFENPPSQAELSRLIGQLTTATRDTRLASRLASDLMGAGQDAEQLAMFTMRLGREIANAAKEDPARLAPVDRAFQEITEGKRSGTRRFRYVDVGGLARGREKDLSFDNSNATAVRRNGNKLSLYLTNAESTRLQGVYKALVEAPDAVEYALPPRFKDVEFARIGSGGTRYEARFRSKSGTGGELTLRPEGGQGPVVKASSEGITAEINKLSYAVRPLSADKLELNGGPQGESYTVERRDGTVFVIDQRTNAQVRSPAFAKDAELALDAVGGLVRAERAPRGLVATFEPVELDGQALAAARVQDGAGVVRATVARTAEGYEARNDRTPGRGRAAFKPVSFDAEGALVLPDGSRFVRGGPGIPEQLLKKDGTVEKDAAAVRYAEGVLRGIEALSAPRATAPELAFTPAGGVPAKTASGVRISDAKASGQTPRTLTITSPSGRNERGALTLGDTPRLRYDGQDYVVRFGEDGSARVSFPRSGELRFFRNANGNVGFDNSGQSENPAGGPLNQYSNATAFRELADGVLTAVEQLRGGKQGDADGLFVERAGERITVRDGLGTVVGTVGPGRNGPSIQVPFRNGSTGNLGEVSLSPGSDGGFTFRYGDGEYLYRPQLRGTEREAVTLSDLTPAGAEVLAVGRRYKRLADLAGRGTEARERSASALQTAADLTPAFARNGFRYDQVDYGFNGAGRRYRISRASDDQVLGTYDFGSNSGRLRAVGDETNYTLFPTADGGAIAVDSATGGGLTLRLSAGEAPGAAKVEILKEQEGTTQEQRDFVLAPEFGELAAGWLELARPLRTQDAFNADGLRVESSNGRVLDTLSKEVLRPASGGGDNYVSDYLPNSFTIQKQEDGTFLFGGAFRDKLRYQPAKRGTEEEVVTESGEPVTDPLTVSVGRAIALRDATPLGPKPEELIPDRNGGVSVLGRDGMNYRINNRSNDDSRGFSISNDRFATLLNVRITPANELMVTTPDGEVPLRRAVRAKVATTQLARLAESYAKDFLKVDPPITQVQTVNERFQISPSRLTVKDTVTGTDYTVVRQDGEIRLTRPDGREFRPLVLDDGAGPRAQLLERRDFDKLIWGAGLSTASGQLLSKVLPEGTNPNAPLERNDAVAVPLAGEVPSLGNVNIARQVAGKNIFLIGPTAGNIVPADQLANVKENVASLFNLVPRSEALGELLAEKIAAAPVARGLEGTLPELPATPLASFVGKDALSTPATRTLELPAETPLERLQEKPPTGFENARLRFLLAAALSRLRFNATPEGSEVRFTVTARKDATVEDAVPVQLASNNLEAASLKKLGKQLLASPEAARMLRDALNVTGQSYEIRIPVAADGRPEVELLSAAPFYEAPNGGFFGRGL